MSAQEKDQRDLERLVWIKILAELEDLSNLTPENRLELIAILAS